MANTFSHKDYTIAIVSALSEEMAAVRYMLKSEHSRLRRQPNDKNSYILGDMGGHNVVLVSLPGTQGTVAAKDVVDNLLRTFPSIKYSFFVGIGGGVAGRTPEVRKARDLRLGDVVVGWPAGEAHHGVVQYDQGRETPTGWEFKGAMTPSSQILRSEISVMRGELQLRKKIQGHIAEMLKMLEEEDSDVAAKYARPPPDTDILFADEVGHVTTAEGCKGCGIENALSKDRQARKPEGIPKIHYGLIASGNTLFRDPFERNKIIDRVSVFGNPLCFDMEAAGVSTESECLVIRGISDYADTHKNKRWQHYAAAAAAAYTKELLLRLEPEEVAGEPEHDDSGGRYYQNIGITNRGNFTARDINISG